MKNILRNGALALSLVAGAALIAASASVVEAKSIQRDGYFGGTWAPIGPKDNRYVKRHHRNHGYYARGYRDRYGPRYSYDVPRYRYGYRAPYDYGYDRGPGFSITIR